MSAQPHSYASEGSHHEQERHAEAATKYKIDHVDDDEFDADLQIDDIIRNAPTSLQNKKTLKSQYSKKPPKQLSYYKAFKYSAGIKWSQFKFQVHDLSLQFEVWRSSLKVVEGKFGTAVVSYFIFLKWLLFLNIYITVLVLGLMVVPQIILGPKYIPNTGTEVCEKGYDDTVNRVCLGEKGATCIVDFLEGSGWMEQTVLFVGYYSPYYVTNEATYDGTEVDNKYDIPLAYLLTTAGIFILSFLMMSNYTSKALQDNLASSEDSYYKYCSKVFCGWDYLLTDSNSASFKKRGIHYELTSDLAEESRALERAKRTIWQKLKLYTIRIILNLIVLAILGGAFWVIFYVTDFSIENSNRDDIIPFLGLVISFLPSVVITILNGIIPVIFNIMVRLEDYSPQFEIFVTLGRTVFLRLASLVILFFSLYRQITCDEEEYDECRYCTDSGVRCWETAIGQEFYKLALTDFAAVLVVVFMVEFPRKLGAKYLKIGIAQSLGEMEFEIPKNVLAIVYSQALCWMGLFFCPFLPLMTAAKLFIIFYLKKLSLLSNMMPSQKPFRASRSGIFFMVILIITFLMCILPVGFFIINIEPSAGCSPFRLQDNGTIWTELSETLEEWDSFMAEVFQFLGSAAFYIPLIIFLLLLLYYYTAVGSAQLGMIGLLKEQLVMEGRDKHFLLTRIDELIQADLGGKQQKSFFRQR